MFSRQDFWSSSFIAPRAVPWRAPRAPRHPWQRAASRRAPRVGWGNLSCLGGLDDMCILTCHVNQHANGKSTFWIGNTSNTSSKNTFSIVMLVYQRVYKGLGPGFNFFQHFYYMIFFRFLDGFITFRKIEHGASHTWLITMGIVALQFVGWCHLWMSLHHPSCDPSTMVSLYLCKGVVMEVHCWRCRVAFQQWWYYGRPMTYGPMGWGRIIQSQKGWVGDIMIWSLRYCISQNCFCQTCWVAQMMLHKVLSASGDWLNHRDRCQPDFLCRRANCIMDQI